MCVVDSQGLPHKRLMLYFGGSDERTIWAMAQIVGEDKFFWATDYPHPIIRALPRRVARYDQRMTPGARRGVLGENVAKATSSASSVASFIAAESVGEIR